MTTEDTANRTPLADFLGLAAAEYPEIKRYELIGLIGSGGMGRVMLGWDKKLDREVAIKLLAQGDDETRQRFYREAKIAAALNHPSIVKIMDYSGKDVPAPFIVMERLNGHDLAHYLDTAPMTEALACAVAHELAEALSHAHASGLVHRDIKPENVILEPTGRVVLIDFGLAKGTDVTSERQTFVGGQTKLMGTPLFSSPEQLLGTAPLSPKSDLYSLGALMYFMVSQATPYQSDSLVALLSALRSKPPVPLDRVAKVSPAYLALVTQLLQRDPQARPTSAEVVSQALEPLLAKHRVLSIASETKSFLAKRPAPRRDVTAITALPNKKPLTVTDTQETAPPAMNDTSPQGTPLAGVLGLDPQQHPQLDRYTLLGLLGSGGMGKVFLGYDKRLQREVAIKVIANEVVDQTALDRFYREAKIAAAMSHPNIIKMVDYSGPGVARQFIVMERLLGHDLDHFLESKTIDEPTACAIAHAVAEALAHAHAQGLVHRDVKPGNIVIEPGGRVVLIDFGLAVGVDPDADRKTFVAAKTRLVGTPLYASPEQLTGSAPLSLRSDLYSLGALMYFMVSLKPPFDVHSMRELLEAFRQHEPMPLTKRVKVSQPYAALTHRLLEKDPQKRLASAEAVVTELKKQLAAHRAIASELTAQLVDQRPGDRVEVTSISAALRSDDDQPAPPDATVVTARPKHDDTQVAQRPSAKTTTEVATSRRWLPFAAAGLVMLALVGVGVRVLAKRRTAPAPVAPPAAVQVEPSPPPPLPAPAATQARTTLYVLVKPWGRVWVDGSPQGMTPAFRKIELPEGEHTIEVKHPQLGERSVAVTLRGEPEREVVVDFTR